LAPALEQAARIRDTPIDRVLVDEGYRGRSKIGETEVVRAHRHAQDISKYKHRKYFRRRASVEASISHLKIDHRMSRNYLKGSIGDSINCMLAAAAFNLKMYLNRIRFFCLYSAWRYFVYMTLLWVSFSDFQGRLFMISFVKQ
jgi:IS5 family transposase